MCTWFDRHHNANPDDRRLVSSTCGYPRDTSVALRISYLSEHKAHPTDMANTRLTHVVDLPRVLP
jgi:hypothetical protein